MPRDAKCLAKLKAQEEETLRLQEQIGHLGSGIVAGLQGARPCACEDSCGEHLRALEQKVGSTQAPGGVRMKCLARIKSQISAARWTSPRRAHVVHAVHVWPDAGVLEGPYSRDSGDASEGCLDCTLPS